MKRVKPVYISIIVVVIVSIMLVSSLYCEAMGTHAGVEKYNLLLITIDTLRPDHLGCYGYRDIKTPHIDSLASEGVVFTRAYTPVPITLPSHVSLMTGLYPLQHGVRNNGNYILGTEAVTLAEVMKTRGYRTGACIGAFVLDSLFGLNQGFDFYEDSLPGEGTATILESERRAEAVTNAGINWLSQIGESPFFLWLHYFDPHAIYLPPSPFNSEYKGHLYDGEIAYTDKCIGDFFQALKNRGLMEKTVIILTADHGEGLGEHGEPTHAIFLYDSTLHVPLIIRTPGRIFPQGKRLDSMVSILDIFPTVLDLFTIHLKNDELPHLPGKSLIPLIMGKKESLHETILCESLYPELNFGWSRIEGVRTSEWKYIKSPRSELYFLKDDPHEEKNIIAEEGNVWEGKLRELKRVLGHEKQTRVGLDEGVKAKLRSLGYVWTVSGYSKEEKPDPKDMISLLDMMDRGVSLIYMGLYEQARAEFKKILELNPDNASALFYLASIEEKTGNLGEAERLFRDVLTLSAHYLDVHNHLGLIYHKQGKLDQSIQEFEYAVIEAEYPEIYYNLSVVYRQKGELEKSLQVTMKALELDPTYPNVFNQLGQLSLDKGDIREAKEFFKKALQLKPDLLEAHNNLGVVFYSEKNEDEAIKEFRDALAIDPNNAGALNNLGSIYLSKRLYDEAEKVFKRVLLIQPEYFEGLLNLGMTCFYKENYAEAEECYLRALALNPENSKTLIHLGQLYMTQHDYTKALEVFDKVVGLGIESAELFFFIGQTFLGLKRENAALKSWGKGISLDPNYRQIYLQMAQLFCDLGKPEEAFSAWDKAYKLDTQDTLPLTNMATIHFQRGEYNDAIHLWEEAIKTDSEQHGLYLHIGTAYLKMNKIDMAIQTWQRLLDMGKNNVEVLINLGTGFYQKNDITKAIDFWEKAEEIDSENPKIHYNLGVAFFHQGDCPRSVKELKEALRLQPDNNEAIMLLRQTAMMCPGQS